MVSLIFLMAIVMMGFAGMSFYFFFNARKQEQQQQLPPGYANTFTPARQLTSGQGGDEVTGTNLANLNLGDIVSHFGTDYIVEGKLNYWDEGYTWVTYMLVDGTNKRWLSVEEDDMLEVSLWDEIRDLPIQDEPPEFLDYRGERFRMVERGQARVNQEGKTGNKTGMEAIYYEYEGEGDTFISVERWGRSYEASIGKEIHPAELDVLPGDLVEF